MGAVRIVCVLLKSVLGFFKRKDMVWLFKMECRVMRGYGGPEFRNLG